MMIERQNPNRDGATARTERAGAEMDKCAFDIWLHQSLANRHDGALAETLPNDWIDLIRRSG